MDKYEKEKGRDIFITSGWDGNIKEDRKMPSSYADAVQNEANKNGNPHKRKVNFRFMKFEVDLEGVDACLPLKSIQDSSIRYVNTLCGYFLGSRMVFPVVQNYVNNVWAKFGLEKMMMTSKGFFFYKFKSEKGYDRCDGRRSVDGS